MAISPAAPQSRPPTKRRSGAGSYLVWGSLAVCAVVAASVLMALGIGATRGGFGVQTTARPPVQTIVQKPPVSEFEIARLNDALRALTAERERLAARVDQLEHSLGDITASINTAKERHVATANARPEAAATPVSPAAAPAASIEPADGPPPPLLATPAGAIPQSPRPASVQPPAPLPSAAELEPGKAVPPRAARPIQIAPRSPPAPKAVKTNPTPVVSAAPVAPTQAAPKGPPTQVAQILQPVNAPVPDAGTNRTEFAIDLGGEMSIDGLRARWANIKGNHGAALEGLRPLVSVREGVKPGTVELRLIAGPVANAGDAAKVCATLQTKGVACRTTEFDGQRLSLR
jgi:hypothetical protein